MIGELWGVIARKGAGFMILDVQGVGYTLYVTAHTYQTLSLKQKAHFYTHLAVREDALILFGFETYSELRLFEMLISVSGIGPKSALAILSLTDADTLIAAIRAGESSYMTKVSGVGRKSAEKIILELKDKLGPTTADVAEGHFAAEGEALEALEALGYGIREAREALKLVPKETTDTGERLKAALRHLANH